MTYKHCLILIAVLSQSIMIGQDVRTIDGQDNNVLNPSWGSDHDVLLNIVTPSFGDSISSMGTYDRPNPRRISNHMFAQQEIIQDERHLSDFTWVFGQFIDHEIILVENDGSEPLFINIPDNDPVFPPNASPIIMSRSMEAPGTGTSPENPRRYTNAITAYIDGSAVYGSDIERANWLRTFQDGKLKVSEDNLLPWNTVTGNFNDPRDPNAPMMELNGPVRPVKFFIAGDIRANENPLLATFHILFVREHNRMCDEIKEADPSLTDEEIYQKARKWVGGFIQNIVFEEWLPTMGLHLPPYRGYRSEVNPQISNVFSAAAFRMGHTLINSNLLRLEGDGKEVPGGSISLRDAFFNPTVINLVGGIDPYLRGMASQVQQRLDCKVIDDVRNFLFGPPEAGGMDLAAININRGRERGLPDYNTIRRELGLPELKAMEEISNNEADVDHLLEIYGSVDNIDPWVGMLAEEYMPDAMFGATIMTILERQFLRLRDGDRFYFEADGAFTEDEIAEIKSTTMRDIIMRNTDIKIMQENVFQAMPIDEIPEGPSISAIDLSAEVYPNPTTESANIRMYADASYPVDVEVYDNIGRMIYSFAYDVEPGENDIPLELADFDDSNYFNIVVRKNSLEYGMMRLIKVAE